MPPSETIIRRAVVTLSGEDTKDVRVQQIGFNGAAIDAEVWAPYGFSYNVPVGSLGVLLTIGGDQGNYIFLPDRSEDRIKGLEDGETAVFNPLTGTNMIFKSNGDIEIVTAGTQGDLNITVKGDAKITAATTTVTGDMTVDGKLTVTGDADVGGNVDVSGDLDATNIDASSDVKAGSISLNSHRHGGSITAPTGSITPTGLPI